MPGLLAAEELSKSLKDYQKNCNKKLKKDLWLGLLMRKAMNNFTDKDYNTLVKYFSRAKVKKIIEDENRDFPSKFIVKLIITEPRLLRFATKIF